MSTIIGGDVWGNPNVIMAAIKAPQRIFCVAYVTRYMPILFKRGDVLICDASKKAVSSGETDPSILKSLLDVGVKVFSVSALHVKCAIFGTSVLVGSANMSDSSAMILTEMAVLSEDAELSKNLRAFLRNTVKDVPAIGNADLDALISLYRSEREPWQNAMEHRLVSSTGHEQIAPLKDPKFWIGNVRITTWPDGGESAQLGFRNWGSREMEYHKLTKRSIRLVRQAMTNESYLRQEKKTVFCKGMPTEIVEDVTLDVRILFDNARINDEYLEIASVACEPQPDWEEIEALFASVPLANSPNRSC